MTELCVFGKGDPEPDPHIDVVEDCDGDFWWRVDNEWRSICARIPLKWAALLKFAPLTARHATHEYVKGAP
jgi:hypothetical protein